MMQSAHGEESTLEVPKSVSSLSENEVTEPKQNDTKPTDTPVIHHSGPVDLVQSLLDANNIEIFETVLKSLQNAIYEINQPVPLEFSQVYRVLEAFTIYICVLVYANMLEPNLFLSFNSSFPK